MFKNPFSFNGRIRRTEYGISFIIYFVLYFFVEIVADGRTGVKSFFLLMIPALWFLWAQGAKRCHDLGNSGWWQIIPFYGFWLLFQKGMFGQNEYDEDPKGNFDAMDYVDPYPIHTTNGDKPGADTNNLTDGEVS